MVYVEKSMKSEAAIMPHVMAASKLALMPFHRAEGSRNGHRDEEATLPRPYPMKNYSPCGSTFRSALFLSIACSRLKPLTAHSQTRPHAAASPAFSQKNPLSSVESAATMCCCRPKTDHVSG